MCRAFCLLTIMPSPRHAVYKGWVPLLLLSQIIHWPPLCLAYSWAQALPVAIFPQFAAPTPLPCRSSNHTHCSFCIWGYVGLYTSPLGLYPWLGHKVLSGPPLHLERWVIRESPVSGWQHTWMNVGIIEAALVLRWYLLSSIEKSSNIYPAHNKELLYRIKWIHGKCMHGVIGITF